MNEGAAGAGQAGGNALIISCEHGGYEVPPAYSPLFLGHEALLETHRGWDAGALELAQQMAKAFGAPLFAATTTRLLIDLNRSIGHRQLHSEATRGLAPATRREIAAQHYRPHRDAVESAVERRIAAGERVLHIASHSFTPELHGLVRQADVACLYDPRRAGESALASHWLSALRRRRPELKLRRNYPYQGKGDGLTSLLRKRHAPEHYVGIELEVNQRFVIAGGEAWTALRADIIQALADTLAGRYGTAGAKSMASNTVLNDIYCLPRLFKKDHAMTATETATTTAIPEIAKAPSPIPPKAAPAAVASQDAASAPATTVTKPAAKKSPAAAKPAAKKVSRMPAKAATKPVAKEPAAAAKPAAKAASRLPAKPAAKAASKPSAKPVPKATPKPTVKRAASQKSEKELKEKKPKLVRDSFTIPKAEYTILDELKNRAGKLGSSVKKSELIRAGIKALAAMSDANYLGAMKVVPTIKTGRPSKK